MYGDRITDLLDRGTANQELKLREELGGRGVFVEGQHFEQVGSGAGKTGHEHLSVPVSLCASQGKQRMLCI